MLEAILVDLYLWASHIKFFLECPSYDMKTLGVFPASSVIHGNKYNC